MSSKALLAKTHPPEYLMHKYWARKPHNILHHYIRTYFREGNLVVDPFCGSGVFLAETKKNNINAIGFDINPIACLISEVTINPPNTNKIDDEINKLIGHIKQEYSDLYLVDNKPIRYLVHEINTKCQDCGNAGSPNNSRKQNKKYYCLRCGNRLSFNLERFTGTSIVQIYDRNNNKYEDEHILLKQEKLSKVKEFAEGFDHKLLINRRILAFPGMKVSDLFTPRAFTLLSNAYRKAYGIMDERVRNAVLLFLSSAVAQCSRLIPYRNNLSTGGPAWTIPGFWVAPIHLETNPIIHFEARYKKFMRGLSSLNNKYKGHSVQVSVENIPAQQGLEKIQDHTLDGIFFDPPYGDNVPYLEFSEIWNCFLKRNIEYEKEIVVSDRKEHVSSWGKYSGDIEDIVKLFHRKLKDDAKVIMTFNNLDPRAWKIVLEAFAKCQFKCIDAKYQIPAVISSKAQKASNTSYVGDYYCVFVKGRGNEKISDDLHRITEKINVALLSRGGIAPQNLINRLAILTILNENLNINFIERIQEAVSPIARQNGEYYQLRDELMDNELVKQHRIEDIVKAIAIKEMKGGCKDINSLYETILEKTDEIGSPPFSEVVQMLEGIVIFDKDRCNLRSDYPHQAPLF